jgi:NAD(P)-dependent dehydrogenase (short-subunit alcohol dehydrogenase family)
MPCSKLEVSTVQHRTLSGAGCLHQSPLSYAASKAGLVALTRSMAAEWATQGVRVNVVSPGVIDTSMVRIMDNPEAGRRLA